MSPVGGSSAGVRHGAQITTPAAMARTTTAAAAKRPHPRRRPRRCGPGLTGAGATTASPRGRGPVRRPRRHPAERRRRVPRPRAGCPVRRTAPCRAACGPPPRSPARRGAGPPRRTGDLGRDSGRGQQRVQVGQVGAQPAERVGGQFLGKDPPARVPAGEPGVVVGAVEAARPARHRFQQVGTPDRLADLDGLRGVDGSLQLTAAENPQFEPDAVLGSLLALARIGVYEVDIPHHHADPLESEGVEHRDPLLAVIVLLIRLVILTRGGDSGLGSVPAGSLPLQDEKPGLLWRREFAAKLGTAPSRSQATTEGTGDHDRAY